MAMTRQALLRSLAGASLWLGAPRIGRGQGSALGDLRILVGFPPGGPLDIAARTIARCGYRDYAQVTEMFEALRPNDRGAFTPETSDRV